MVHSPKNRSTGFTIMELLIVICIMLILSALIVPAVNKSKEMARRTYCLNNLRTLGVALIVYAEDYHGDFPPDGAPPNTWASYIYPTYVKDERLFDCPTHEYVGTVATGADYWYRAGLNTHTSPPNSLLIGDYDGCHYGSENKITVNGKTWFLLPGVDP
jgi:type II secretory pathway pseudopilin PulG